MKSNDAPGFDTARVEAWVGGHIPWLTPPLEWRRFANGHSNLTYLLTGANQGRAVIRRPPLGKLIPKAHDMRREWRLISALQNSPVPTPSALGFCDDTAVADAPFYVMGYVEGHALATSDDTLKHVPENLREKLGYEAGHFTMHDIRRTVATGLQRLGIPLVVSEAVLNHQSGSAMAGVAGVYHRHQYTNEKREALALWGKEVMQIAAKYPVEVKVG